MDGKPYNVTPRTLRGGRRARQVLLCISFVIVIAMAIISEAKSAPLGDFSDDRSGFRYSTVTTLSPRELAHQRRARTKRVYSLMDHCIFICALVFLSAIFAGLTLGVMCADYLTLEIIASSGPEPDCTYAAKVLPLRRGGHHTLCALIIANMLCNVLIVQEFNTVFNLLHTLKTNQANSHPVESEGGASGLLGFLISTAVIVLFTELIPMSICKSKHSLKVAAAGAIFVRIAMVLTYFVSVPLGKFLDWLVKGEARQIYDRNELRKLMVVHYDRRGDAGAMTKSELKLLLAAMDFHERKVCDIMTPIDKALVVRATDVVTPDFVERLWLSGRSRIPVEYAPGEFKDVLVVKDLIIVYNRFATEEVTVQHVVSARNRLFGQVSENTSLPAMLKYFQDAKIHMAVVYRDGGFESQEAVPSASDHHMHSSFTGSLDGTVRRRHALPVREVLGVVTLEDVVEKLLNDEIYDEDDNHDPIGSPMLDASFSFQSCLTRPRTERRSRSLNRGFARIPPEPRMPPRVNFYSYLTHPECKVPLTEAQVWAAAYFLNRTVRSFVLWSPGYIKMLLDECSDTQLVPPRPTDNEPSLQTGEAHSMSDSHSDMGSYSSTFHMAMTTVCLGDHSDFLRDAAGERYILYSYDQPSDMFTLVLGGQVDVLVGRERFLTRLLSFDTIGEEALTEPVYIPNFSAIVRTPARMYRIPKGKYAKYAAHQFSRNSEHRVQMSRPMERVRWRSSSSVAVSSVTSPQKDLLIGHSNISTRSSDFPQYGTFKHT